MLRTALLLLLALLAASCRCSGDGGGAPAGMDNVGLPDSRPALPSIDLGVEPSDLGVDERPAADRGGDEPGLPDPGLPDPGVEDPGSPDLGPPDVGPTDPGLGDPAPALCAECEEEQDCPWPTACAVPDEGDGPGRCLRLCDPLSPACAEGRSCEPGEDLAGEQIHVCAPSKGWCCAEATRGLEVPCEVSNEHGTCSGLRRCEGETGFGPCDARFPAAESCDDQDNDCNGETDEGLDILCSCGDGSCVGAGGEDALTCPADCSACGDGACSPGEDPSVCPEDCCAGPDGSAGCGDGRCMGYACGEDPDTCPEDCGTACGDGTCERGESPWSCPEDCKHSACGNRVCEPGDGGPGECPEDCAPACGDCICNFGEGFLGCPGDCGYCGDGVCSSCPHLGEHDGCPVDCHPPGDEACNGEDDDGDGVVDEEGAAGCVAFLVDADGDGYGTLDDARCLCSPRALYRSRLPGDCDDARPEDHPGAEELCDNRDNDCNGEVDQVACDDGVPCTVEDLCETGVCEGRRKRCHHLNDTCHEFACDEATGDCVSTVLGHLDACKLGPVVSRPVGFVTDLQVPPPPPNNAGLLVSRPIGFRTDLSEPAPMPDTHGPTVSRPVGFSTDLKEGESEP